MASAESPSEVREETESPVEALERSASPQARDSLTIGSVAYRSRAYLELNVELTRKLNPSLDLARWLVVDNTPIGEDGRMPKTDARFEMLPGVKKPPLVKGHASLQHGKALNRVVTSSKSRFLLLMDPDFFVVRKDWVSAVVEHMKKHRLAFFGVPWHPRWYRKWRYFPCTHCLFVDTSRIDKDELDFLPDISHQPKPYHSMFLYELEWMWSRGEKLKALLTAARHPRITLAEDRIRRLVIGSSRDTGIEIFERFARRPGLRHETFTPVYRPREDRLVPPPDVRIDTRSPFREALERLRPDWMSFVPKRWGAYSKKGFSDHGLPDVRSRGWEEFLWEGKPFGFHVRKSFQRQQDPGELARDVEQTIDRVQACL